MPILHESLLALNVKCKPAPETLGDRQQLRIRIGGLDRRKVVFKGWVIIETFNYGNEEGSFCVMQRDEVFIFSNSSSSLESLNISYRDRLCHGDNSGKPL